jgi:hypothetical protein
MTDAEAPAPVAAARYFRVYQQLALLMSRVQRENVVVRRFLVGPRTVRTLTEELEVLEHTRMGRWIELSTIADGSERVGTYRGVPLVLVGDEDALEMVVTW